jgi:AraC-like DNA-binding protein
MKIVSFIIPKTKESTLIYQQDEGPFFYEKLHQHEEIQICHILRGEGTLVIGDSINPYKKGDVIVIGSFIPHVFKSDVEASSVSKMTSLFFTKDSFGHEFFDLEAFQELRSFFEKSSYGFKLIASKNAVSKLFSKINIATKLQRFILFLDLLKILSFAEHQRLSSFIYEKKYTPIEGKRITDVLEYTFENYDKDVSLELVAQVASMTKNSFCKYFKKITNKTYFEFLKEVRVEYACKLIRKHNDMRIADVAYLCGFKNISNFNKQFKTVTNLNPSNFKKLL